MGAGFLVSVRGAPRVGPEVEKRAKAEAQTALQRLLVAAAPAPPAEASDTVEEEPPALALTPVDVANRGCFVLLLTGGPSTPEAAGALVQAAYVALATAVSAGTAADDGLGFQYCDKILPLQVQLGAPTAGGISEAVRALLGLSPPADGSSVAVLVHSRGDDVHGAAERGGAQLTSVETREAVLQATVQAGCGVNLQVRADRPAAPCKRARLTARGASAGTRLGGCGHVLARRCHRSGIGRHRSGARRVDSHEAAPRACPPPAPESGPCCRRDQVQGAEEARSARE
jgi:hypothetical protein